MNFTQNFIGSKMALNMFSEMTAQHIHLNKFKQLNWNFIWIFLHRSRFSLLLLSFRICERRLVACAKCFSVESNV